MNPYLKGKFKITAVLFLSLFLLSVTTGYVLAYEKISGNIVDVVKKQIYPGVLIIDNGKIVDIKKTRERYNTFIVPGLIDAHVHIESSMLVPSEFARLAVVHGTVATVSDPHEIANVLGVPGVEYMIENGKNVPFKFYFGASPCVPATDFETAGAKLDVEQVEDLLKRKEIKYMSEMMNYPGVLFNDAQVMAKIAVAKKLGKPIDGHAPGLMGKDLEKYVSAGITTDHETLTLDEGREKVKLGMKVIIREGSAAKQFDALSPLIKENPEMCMFCSDDKHPDDLIKGHIDQMVRKAIKLGYDKMNVLRCATYNPVKHYKLDVGLLQKGDPADFIIVDDLKNFTILKTYINGKCVAEKGKTLIHRTKVKIANKFNVTKKKPSDFQIKAMGPEINVIVAKDGQLITDRLRIKTKTANDLAVPNLDDDILKLAVVNRYKDAPIAVAFINNFGLKKGAIASSVAHDSHNILAVGTSDEDITKAVNLVIENKGGLAIANGSETEILPLPIAGLMTDEDGYKVAEKYSKMTMKVKEWGSTLRAPYMTLSFMALLVIPDLKLSDKGLFDGKKFQFRDLFDVRD